METTKPMGTKKKTNSGFACISLDEKSESPGFFGKIYTRIYHKKNLEKKTERIYECLKIQISDNS
jgi:hypothetical protein